jgi:hypothetical protein
MMINTRQRNRYNLNMPQGGNKLQGAYSFADPRNQRHVAVKAFGNNKGLVVNQNQVGGVGLRLPNTTCCTSSSLKTTTDTDPDTGTDTDVGKYHSNTFSFAGEFDGEARKGDCFLSYGSGSANVRHYGLPIGFAFKLLRICVAIAPQSGTGTNKFVIYYGNDRVKGLLLDEITVTDQTEMLIFSPKDFSKVGVDKAAKAPGLINAAFTNVEGDLFSHIRVTFFLASINPL